MYMYRYIFVRVCVCTVFVGVFIFFICVCMCIHKDTHARVVYVLPKEGLSRLQTFWLTDIFFLNKHFVTSKMWQVSPPMEHIQGGQWWTRYSVLHVCICSCIHIYVFVYVDIYI